MRAPILCLLALLPFSASAFDRCEHTAPRDLSLDLKGVKTVVFEIRSHDLDLRASKGAAAGVKGRACASDAKLLALLTLTQERVGDKLIVRAGQEGGIHFMGVGKHYVNLDLAATLPDHIPVQLKVGSGDATVSGVVSLSADVGSGDVTASHVRGAVFADVGSGDIQLDDIGSLRVLEVGSGDLDVRAVRGPVQVGKVNSGDLKIRGTRGKVAIGSLGSGDVGLHDIGGDASVDSVGSGSVDASDVRGSFTVTDVGSGSVSHRGVSGRVQVPAED